MAKEKRKSGKSINESIGRTGLAKGTITNAIITFITRLIFFVLLPVWILGAFISIAQTDLSPSAPLFISACTQLQNYLMIFGIPLAIVAGLWAYHLRYTKARLFFGLLGSLLLVMYGGALLLTAPINDALTALGWVFPVWLAFGIVSYRAVRNSMLFIRDYSFFKERARKMAKTQDDVPFKPKLGRGEFTTKIGTVSIGASNAEKMIRSTITVIPFWLILIIFILSAFGFGDTENSQRFLDVLLAMGGLFLLLGIPMAILSFFVGFYPKGTISRTLCDLVNSILFILLIYWLFVASGLPDIITDSGLILSLTPLILAILIWAVVDIIRVGAEYRDERRNWKKSVGYDVAPKKKKFFRIQPESKWYDFNPSIGKFSRGAVDAKKEILRFVTIPEIVILLAIGAMRSAGTTGTLYSIMETWSVNILIFGLLIAFVAFWRGYFPPGTFSRLLIGLLIVPSLLLYVRGLELGGTLDEALKDVGLVLPMEEINLLILIFIAFIGVMQVGELLDARRSWKIAVGKKVKPIKPIKKMSRRQEFRIRFGSKHQGIVWMRKGVVRYMYYTSIFIIVLLTIVNSLIYAAVDVDLQALSNGLNDVFYALLLAAIPLAAFRAFYGFYFAGSTSKLLFGFLVAVAGANYTYNAFMGGEIVKAGEWGNVAAGISIDFFFIIALFFIGWIFYCIMVLVEYTSYRKDWIANDYRPVEGTEAEEAMKFRRLVSKEDLRMTKLDARAKKRAAKRAKRKGTTVAEEEEREVAAKEADVKIADVDEEEAVAEDKEKTVPAEKDEVEEELEVELGTKELEEHKEAAVIEENKAAEVAPPPEQEPPEDADQSEEPSPEEKKE
jgi:hypothetical protein